MGDPIPDNHGKAGANGHIATSESVNKVRMLLVAGYDKKDIAAQLGISIPTLSKHYFSRGLKQIERARSSALAAAKAKNILRLDQAAGKGNVAAIKALNDIYQAELISILAAEIAGGRVGEDPKPKAAPRGKKDQQVDAAKATLKNNPLLDPTRLN
ncbi:MAG: hypothetical protein ABJL99_10090 [Aliishimia sp.]